MKDFLSLFLLEPVFRGFFALLISGSSFPLCGVMVLRLNLIPLRYMLMHGVILGGAIALATSLPVVPSVIVINFLLVIFILLFTQNFDFGFSGTSAALMVLSMALESLITHIFDVPSKDTLNILWGSPFALSNTDIISLVVLSFILILYIILNFQTILNLFFSQEISKSNGLNVKFHYTIMILIIAFVIAIAMKLLGALMIDSLLLLPVLIATKFQKIRKKSNGIKNLFLQSSIFGFIISFSGYIIAIALDFPPGVTIALLAGILYTIITLISKLKKKSN